MSFNTAKLVFFTLTTTFCTFASAADGVINFTGNITAASCAVTPGAGTQVQGNQGSQTISVGLGSVSMDSLGDSSATNIVGAKTINLNLNCGGTASGLNTVKVQFDPVSGSGLDTNNNSLLKTTGTATGVGIGIFNNNGNLINLSGNENITGSLTSTGSGENITYSAQLNLRAGYVANGADKAAGTANGTLPFTLIYE
ncbi:type 1 fimbrial protein [Acinetobacter soli]|uniref:fimbrial protein n=1 Tax=Acinetobacter TaxID=469 RepID=UPI00124C959D|nr:MULTISPECIES: fimbrial protein [Acinetobacter]MCF3128280.1 type 1 fimbrial protein [Acinetobacter soli]MDI3379617.1 fimbrial protein [Acinetobacter sp. V89_7]